MSAKGVNPSTLVQPAEIQNNFPVYNDAGKKTDHWVSIDPESFVSIRPKVSSEGERAGRIESIATHTVAAHFHPEISSGSRIVFRDIYTDKDREFHLVGGARYYPREGPPLYVVFDCKEREG